MARLKQRLTRIETEAPVDDETSFATSFLRTLETWSAEQTLIKPGDDSTPEQVHRECEMLVEQVHSGEVDCTLTSLVRLAPRSVIYTIHEQAKIRYGDDI